MAKDTNATFIFKNGMLYSAVFDEKNHNGKWQPYKTIKLKGNGYKIKDLKEQYKEEKSESRRDWKFRSGDGSVYWF